MRVTELLRSEAVFDLFNEPYDYLEDVVNGFGWHGTQVGAVWNV